MATQKQAAGATSAFTAAFGTSDLNSLPSGSGVMSSLTAFDNTAGDLFLEWSAQIATMTPGAGAPEFRLYLALLNEDTITFGNGGFASQTAATPPSIQQYGSILALPSTAGIVAGVFSGAGAGLIMPRFKFKLIGFNLLGATLPSSGNQIFIQTTNFTVA